MKTLILGALSALLFLLTRAAGNLDLSGLVGMTGTYDGIILNGHVDSVDPALTRCCSVSGSE